MTTKNLETYPIDTTHELSTWHMLPNRIRSIAGRLTLSASLILAGGVALGDSLVDGQPVAAATETGGYPWSDADHIDKSIARDEITWGYTSKQTCDGKSDAYDCSSTMKEAYYFRDQWGYDLRNCTSYVAWRVAKEFGVNISGWGNGDTWDDNAPNSGFTVDNTPEPGDIAVWDSTHVAFVETVNPNGSVKVSQYNAKNDGLYSVADRTADHYIDINGTGKGLDNTSTATTPAAPPKDVTAISTQFENGTMHVYWGTADGTLRESWYRPGVVHTNVIRKFGSAITALSSQYTPGDMLQHIYTGTMEGTVYETWFGPNSNGYQTWQAYDTDAAITAMSSSPPFDGNQHVYWGTQNGRVGETWFHPGTVNSWEAFKSNSAVHALTSQYTPKDGVQHIYWGNDEGRLHETWFRPGTVRTNLMAAFPSPVISADSQTGLDGNQHVYSGDMQGSVRETWFGPNSGGYNTWLAGQFGSPVKALSSEYTPNGDQHVYSGAGKRIRETWFHPGTVNSWEAAVAGADITAVHDQYTAADGTQHVIWGDTAGELHETWFRPGTVNSWTIAKS